MRGVRGVNGFPVNLTRCLGVLGVASDNASLKRFEVGVLKSNGGAFSSGQSALESCHKLAMSSPVIVTNRSVISMVLFETIVGCLF